METAAIRSRPRRAAITDWFPAGVDSYAGPHPEHRFPALPLRKERCRKHRTCLPIHAQASITFTTGHPGCLASAFWVRSILEGLWSNPRQKTGHRWVSYELTATRLDWDLAVSNLVSEWKSKELLPLPLPPLPFQKYIKCQVSKLYRGLRA